MNAMFAFVRRLGKTSSWCARWAKHFKWLYNDWQGASSTTVVHRLRARIGRLRGDGTDEGLLRQVVETLMPSSHPGTSHRCRPRNANFTALRSWQTRCRKEAETRFDNILERVGSPPGATGAVNTAADAAGAVDTTAGAVVALGVAGAAALPGSGA